VTSTAASLIAELRREGIADKRILDAMERLPRDQFVPKNFVEHAWDNLALPIGSGQTISQPAVVAIMTAALEVSDGHKVLEVGTGSGYQAAILARLCRRVFTIERHAELLKQAQERFKSCRLHNVISRYGDGTKGWPEAAPFERIICTAAGEEVPQSLTDQLAVGGVLVAPIGGERRNQVLVRLRRQADGSVSEEALGPVRFVPLVRGLPRRKPEMLPVNP
jgi:protein-L-isoaspartate(D-aspartate) O-methyltransferase